MREVLNAAQSLDAKIEIVHAGVGSRCSMLRLIRCAACELRALLVQPDAFPSINKRIVALAADALPAMYQTSELVAAGGLMSYGS